VAHLLPPMLEIREHSSYLRRLTALKACAMMATGMDAETVRKEILPVLLDMATDVVRLVAVLVVVFMIHTRGFIRLAHIL